MENNPRNYREYKVWQDAVAFATMVYKVLKQFPHEEKYALCDQLQRAVVSIASNIAEGAARPSDVDFAHFLDVALGSASEVETQLLIAKNIEYIDESKFEELIKIDIDIQKQLTGLLRTLRS